VPNETKRVLLRAVLFATAGFLIFVLPFMFDLWPAGFRWAHPAEHPAYERMIIAVYFALGLCLIPTALDPERHAILIDFTIVSSLLHGAVMTYDSFAQQHEMTHLVGDVPLLFVLAVVLLWLHPRRLRPTATMEQGFASRAAG
jgi:hydrogenase/urease accessory protein HupE